VFRFFGAHVLCDKDQCGYEKCYSDATHVQSFRQVARIAAFCWRISRIVSGVSNSFAGSSAASVSAAE
jgi:hypothetical protein